VGSVIMRKGMMRHGSLANVPASQFVHFQPSRDIGKKYFPKLYIRKPTKDICGICYKLKIHHKTRNKVLNAGGGGAKAINVKDEPKSLDSKGDILEIDDDIQAYNEAFQYENYDRNQSHIERMSHEELKKSS
jgi:hypothetical protein